MVSGVKRSRFDFDRNHQEDKKILEISEKIEQQVDRTLSQANGTNDLFSCARNIINGITIGHKMAEIGNFAKQLYDHRYSDDTKMSPSLSSQTPKEDLNQQPKRISDGGSQDCSFSPEETKSEVPKSVESIQERNSTTPKPSEYVRDVFHQEIPLAALPKKIYEFPRFDEVKHGIKLGLMSARQAAQLHGIHGHDKIYLNEICEWVERQRLNIKDGGPHGEKQLLATKLAIENTVAFIQKIAPHVDAQEVAIIAFKQVGKNYESKVCIERLAKEALREIEIRTRMEGISLNKLEEIVYIRRAPWEASPQRDFRAPWEASPQRDFHEWDKSNEEPNPYSPLGAPGMDNHSFPTYDPPNPGINERSWEEVGDDFSVYRNEEGASFKEIAKDILNGNFGDAIEGICGNSTFEAIMCAQTEELFKESP